MRLLILSLFISAVSSVASEAVFVSPTGDDSANGDRNAPVATLQAALERAREHGAREIVLGAGHYELSASVQFTSEHSGTREQPLVQHANPFIRPFNSFDHQLEFLRVGMG